MPIEHLTPAIEDRALDEIARRAGVASGTLYRHFPTRLDLIEAVLTDQIADLVDLGHRLLTNKDAFDALAAWLHAALRHGLTYRGLSAAVKTAACPPAERTTPRPQAAMTAHHDPDGKKTRP